MRNAERSWNGWNERGKSREERGGVQAGGVAASVDTELRPAIASPAYQKILVEMAATEPLSLLLKAEKKSTVKSIFEHAFRFRDTDGVGGSAEALLGELGIEGKDVTTTGTAVMRAVSELVRDAVYSANTKADVVALCPQGLDERLKGLVADVVVSYVFALLSRC